MFGLILAALGVALVLIGFNRSWATVWGHLYAGIAGAGKTGAKG